jgi:hypothetical protein
MYFFISQAPFLGPKSPLLQLEAEKPLNQHKFRNVNQIFKLMKSIVQTLPSQKDKFMVGVVFSSDESPKRWILIDR